MTEENKITQIRKELGKCPPLGESWAYPWFTDIVDEIIETEDDRYRSIIVDKG